MMKKSNELSPQNSHLVMKVSLIDTIKAIPVGETAIFDCRIAGPMSSAKSCVSRLNKAAGREEYKVSTSDNGATYSVLRK